MLISNSLASHHYQPRSELSITNYKACQVPGPYDVHTCIASTAQRLKDSQHRVPPVICDVRVTSVHLCIIHHKSSDHCYCYCYRSCNHPPLCPVVHTHTADFWTVASRQSPAMRSFSFSFNIYDYDACMMS